MDLHDRTISTLKEILALANPPQGLTEEGREIAALALTIAAYLKHDADLILCVTLIALEDANFSIQRSLDAALSEEQSTILGWLHGSLHPPEWAIARVKQVLEDQADLPFIQQLNAMSLDMAENIFTEEFKAQHPIEPRRINGVGHALSRYWTWDINTIALTGIAALNSIKAHKWAAILAEVTLADEWLSRPVD